MIYLGVDLGKNTGFSAIKDGEFYKSKAIVLKGEYGERYLELERAFEYFVLDDPKIYNDNDEIRFLVYEEPPYVNNRKTYGELSGYEAIIIKNCEAWSIPWLGINNRTLKKEMCGKGDASKEEMMSIAELLLDKDELTQDEADATLCAFYAERLAKINSIEKGS